MMEEITEKPRRKKYTLEYPVCFSRAFNLSGRMDYKVRHDEKKGRQAGRQTDMC
jgi:hypothetical protein